MKQNYIRLFIFIVLTFFLIDCALFLGYPVGYYILKPTTLKNSLDNNNVKKNYQGTGVYVINLDRSPDRYQHIIPTLQRLNLPIHRISAIDGTLLTECDVKRSVDLVSFQRFLNHLPHRGTIGCSLSHIKTWQTFLNSDYAYAFIVEDDVFFNPFQVSGLIKNLTQVKDIWDIVNFESSEYGCPLSIKKIEGGNHLVLYLTEVVNAGAYLLTRAAAQKLLDKALPIKLPVDNYFSRGWEIDLVFMGIEPRPVTQNKDNSPYQSIITSTSNSYSFDINQDKPFFIRENIFSIQSFIIRFFYNLKLFIKYVIYEPHCAEQNNSAHKADQ